MKNGFEFLDHVMTLFYTRIHEYCSNNYDYDRFSYDGIDRSEQFSLQRHKRYLYFFLQHFEEFYQAYSLFDNDTSRRLYIDLILYRLLGHIHIKLPTNNARHWQIREVAQSFVSHPSQLQFRSKFSELKHYERINFNSKALLIDAPWGNVAWAFILKQYYYKCGQTIVEPAEGDYVVDGGAYIGETTLAFAATVGQYGKVYSFEPLQSNLSVLKHNICQNGFDDIVKIVPSGLGDTTHLNTTPVGSAFELNPGFSLNSIQNSDQLPVVAIDSLVESQEIARVDFIKMDIEGYELKALQGALQTLRRFRPKLAISVYHLPEDMFEIPLFLHNLKLGYKFFLDHYTIHQEETILYAIT